MYRNIIATNKNGKSFTFDENFRIYNGFDLSGLPVENYALDTNGDGSLLQNSVISPRTLEIEGNIIKSINNTKSKMFSKKNLLNVVFNPKAGPVRFSFVADNDKRYYIDVQPDALPIMPPDIDNNNAAFQRFMLMGTAHDPFIYSNQSFNFIINKTEPSTLQQEGNEFPVEIHEEFEFIENIDPTSQAGVVDYEGTMETGFEMNIKISNSHDNIGQLTIANAEDETEFMTFSEILLANDEIYINTIRGQEKATIKRGGITYNFLLALSSGSSFLKLRPGLNYFYIKEPSSGGTIDCVATYREVFGGI